MPSIGPTELIIILVIVVVIFGAGKIGDIGGALGRGIREFKENTNEPEKLDTGAGASTDVGKPTMAARQEEPVVRTTGPAQQVRADEI